jgi:hypothetical protein
MKHIVQSLKVFWRSERLIRQNDLRLATQKILFLALAGLVAVFGLVMLSISVFFALVPHLGQAIAALTVAGTDIIIAAILVFYAKAIKPAEEVKMVREVRDMAINDIEGELARTGSELAALRDDLRKFIRNPIDTLLPAAMGPLLGAVVKGVRSSKKHADKPDS